MEVQPMGGGGFYIYLNRGELPPSISPELTAADALRLVRRTVGREFSSSGLRYCLELYEGRDTLLLFARPGAGEPAYFAFRDLEDLIRAAQSCAPGVISFLFSYGDTYYLTVYGDGPERIPACLCEFGEELALSRFFPLFLAEHGAALMGPYAIDKLKSVFGR